MNRRVIMLGAGIVLVVGILLAIKVNSSDSSPKQSPTADDTAKPAGTRPTKVVPTADPAQVTDSEQPKASDYVEREIDGVTVRDHRRDPTQPYKLPTETKQQGSGGRLPGMVVGSLSKQLEAALAECTAKITPENRGATPRLETELLVNIKQGTMTVAESTVRLYDVDGETDGIKQCFSQKSVGQSVPSGSHADAEHYSITLNYHIPK